MRRHFALCLLVACGNSTSTTPDADVGFNKPSKSLKANMEMDKTWMEIGPADLSCLNTATSDMATTTDVALTTKVLDFQSQAAVPQATVTAFPGIDTGSTFGVAVMSDANGNVAMTIPSGQKRFGFKMTASSAMDTFLLNQILDPAMATQTLDKIQSVSVMTATLLPALIGETRVKGTGVAAGALRDCQHHEMSNFVVTISTTQGMATPIAGSEAFYFAAIDPSDIPVHHAQSEGANKDGLFMLIQVPAAPSAFVQAWGYPTDADIASNNLQLISELEVPVLADTVITGSFEPLRK
jgi:hypothetical protein